MSSFARYFRAVAITAAITVALAVLGIALASTTFARGSVVSASAPVSSGPPWGTGSATG